MKRIDERDIMFARMKYKQGGFQYNEYYSRHPEKKKNDDLLRSLPNLWAKGTPTYHPLLSYAVDANYNLLDNVRECFKSEVASEKQDVDKRAVSRLLKNLGIYYGALEIGICEAKEKYFYSYYGMNQSRYGDIVSTNLKNAIIFTVKMEQDIIKTSPRISSCLETSKRYVEASIIGNQISHFIRSLGYNARCQMNGDYQILLTPLAVEAGLGERGRNGLLISGENGCFIRLGGVTTDIDLEYDIRSNYDIKRFCKICNKCARACPAKTINESDIIDNWIISPEKCYSFWRKIGSDCGMCISSCPIGQGISAKEIKNLTNREIEVFLKRFNFISDVRRGSRNEYFLK